MQLSRIKMYPSLDLEESPIDRLLAEQGTLRTPVCLFSNEHDPAEPHQASFYKQLIPLSSPGPNEQYAFHVDLDKCTGCKACVSACHSLNGLGDSETWRDVGSIHGGSRTAPYQQTVTTACHHCVDPACLHGCPVLAYEKDPETGIVRHLDDQCIGCQYCVLKCPYDVPKYSQALGIVRKCDMCHGRLAGSEAPACVQACPTEAISIRIVNTEKIRREAGEGRGFLPAASSPDYTVPTTRYVTKRTIPENVKGGDHGALRPEHTHLPLVAMLTLTQLSVGLYTAAFASTAGDLRWAANLLGLLFLFSGLAVSLAHLGRPLGAWRAFLGLRRSWLSREIVAFGLFAGLAGTYTAAPLTALLPPSGIWALGAITIFTGLISVFCSAMVYHDTRRESWRFSISGGKFFGTTFVLGFGGVAVLRALLDQGPGSREIAVLTVLLTGSKLAAESFRIRSVCDQGFGAKKRSALILVKPLRYWTLARFACGSTGLILFLALATAAPGPVATALAVSGFSFLVAGEWLERTLFFRGAVALKMPGNF